MSGIQQIFQRIEYKYILTEYQYYALRQYLERMARVDRYGDTQILNLYFDTPDYSIIRSSIDAKDYKEKLRLRSYGIPESGSDTFLEIKKKYQGVVYKRRVCMPLEEALDFISTREAETSLRLKCWGLGQTGTSPDPRSGYEPARCTPPAPAAETARRITGEPEETRDPDCSFQILREIDWFFRRLKDLKPRMAISYRRVAMAGTEDPDFRVTFDRDIRWRTDRLSLTEGGPGQPILPEGQYLMELKIAGAIDMGLAAELSRLRIFPVSFSKYGRGYQALVRQTLEGNREPGPVRIPAFTDRQALAVV